MENSSDKEYDSDLQKIKYLKWLPYVGKNYSSSEHKILFIGESHYADNENSFIDHETNINFTRERLDEIIINRKNDFKTKIFNNIDLYLFANNKFERKNLYDNVSMYNFVQRTMDLRDGKDDQPSNNNFKEGWNPFYDIIHILKPTVCVFFGVSAIDHIIRDNIYAFKINSINTINIGNTLSKRRALARKFEINSEHNINVIATRHPGRPYGWKKWNEFINTSIPNEINWLKSKL